jgi:hypothetical protein
MSTIGEHVVEELRRRGVTLTIEPGGLRVHGGSVPAPMVRAIRRNKDSVLAALRKQEQAAQEQESELWTVDRILAYYNGLLSDL